MTTPSFRDFLAQGEEIRALQAQVNGDRMVHALLITGESGTGKRTLASVLAAALLCRGEGNRPCGQCSGCRRAFDREHPDLICIEKGSPLTNDAKKSRNTIPIDDIREMIRLSSAFPLEGGNRVILIANAEDMTPQAQNCLLKILEEPPENNYFLLTSSHPEQMLVTIRSRCRFLKMKPWDEQEIIRILTEDGIDAEKARLAAGSCRGSIGYAKQLVSDENYWKMREEIISSFFRNKERSQIPAVSAKWKDNRAEAGKLFDILEECVRIMMACRIEKKTDPRLGEFSEEWQRFSAEADYERFLFLMRRISEARQQHGFNVNIQVIIEQLLLSFMGEI